MPSSFACVRISGLAPPSVAASIPLRSSRRVNDVLKSDNRSRETVGDDLQAFSASFPGEQFDETKLTDELCGLFEYRGAQNLSRTTRTAVEEAAHDAVACYEDAFQQRHSDCQHLSCCAVRAAKGVPIVLNGYGPDESLGGFPGSHCSMAAADALRRVASGPVLSESSRAWSNSTATVGKGQRR